MEPPVVAVPECERLWTAVDVSKFLGVPVTTLHQWRYLGQGPEAFRVGRHLRYDPARVKAWLVESCASERAGDHGRECRPTFGR